MPACEGTALARLPLREQREWIPAMLPALWHALSRCPHGDLNLDDLLIDPSGRFFRILDPGVRIEGPSLERTPESSDFRSQLFTTNTAHYPLLFPEHGPDPPIRCAANTETLASVLESYKFGGVAVLDQMSGTEYLSDGTSPSAADVIALGAIYAFALTGMPLHELLGLIRPLWTGTFGYRTRGGNLESAERLLEEIEGDRLLRSLRHAGATTGEADLCVRLVALRVNSEEDLRL